MKYPLHSYLLVIFLVVLSGGVLSYTVPAHDLKVTVTRPGNPPTNVDVKVNHEHECVPKEVARTVIPGGLVDEVRVVYSHRKILTPQEIADIKTQAEAWITANGGGNIKLTSPPTNSKNCHGVTFDGGNSWVNDISSYLSNCSPWSPPPATPTAKPPAGTVVVYKKNNKVTHSGRVIATPAGKTGVWVYSQWGHWGDFKHRVDVVHPVYGTGKYYTCP